MIKEPTYYQAQCDICGNVDDGGDFSAWSDPMAARDAAIGAGWTEIGVACSSSAKGAHIYVRQHGEKRSHERSILICESHDPSGIQCCVKCEDDLDEAGWALWPSCRRASQTCPNGHENRLDFLPEPVEEVPRAEG